MSLPFAALAEPRRQEILALLRGGDRSVNEIGAALGMRQPSVSKHLKVLREAGLVSIRPEGARHVAALRTEPLRALDLWLAPYRETWAARLDALEQHLDQMELS